MPKAPASIRTLLSQAVSPTGLAWMRILLGLVLLGELLQLVWFYDLIIPGDAGLDNAGIPFHIAVWVWIPALVMLTLGWFGRAAALVNCICTSFTFGVTTTFAYHADYVYSAAAVFLLIAPVYDVWSVDRLRRELADPLRALRAPRPTISAAWVYAIMFIGIGLIYIDSVGWKIKSRMWVDGLGVWLPASLPQNTWLPAWLLSPLLDQKWFVVSLGYAAFAFEALFVFAMWTKRGRPLLFIIGMGLHLGIIIAFPIPFFGLALVAIYAVVVPDSWWEAVRVRLSLRGKSKAVFPVDPANTKDLRRAVLLRWLDVREAVSIRVSPGASTDDHVFANLLRRTVCGVFATRPVIVRQLSLLCRREVRAPLEVFDRIGASVALPICLMLLAAFVQANLIAFEGPVGRKVWREIGWDRALRVAEPYVAATHQKMRRATGLTTHPVFMDWHFAGYNHVIAVVRVSSLGEETWLPIISQDGRTSTWASGRMWVNWTFRVIGTRLDHKRLSAGLRDYTRVWAKQQNLALKDLHFHVRVKKIRVPFEWEPRLLAKNAASPWLAAGTVSWANGEFVSQVHPDIEQL